MQTSVVQAQQAVYNTAVQLLRDELELTGGAATTGESK